MARGRVASGLFLAQRAEIEKKFSLIVTHADDLPFFNPTDWQPGQLRPYQKRAVEAMIQASNVGGIVLSATGSGKTRLAAAYFKLLKGRAVFVCDELALLEQSRTAIEVELGEKVGVVGHSVFQPQRVSVATIQTLHKHRDKSAFRKWFKKMDVVVIDEVHVAVNKRNIDVVQQISPKACFGLTATLQVEKPHIWMPATALCGPVIFSYDIDEGVREGYLSEGVIYCVEFHDPLTGQSPAYPSMVKDQKVWIEAGSQAAEYRRRVCLNKSRNDCVEAIVREGLKRGRRAVVLVEHLLHLRILDKRFSDVKHQTLSGSVEALVRLQAMKNMDAGKLQLILTTRVFGKGVDIRSVDFIVDATGVPSRNNAIQRYGRGARKADSKNGLIYVDISDRGNRFERASQARATALREIGSPMTFVLWSGNAREVFDRANLSSRR